MTVSVRIYESEEEAQEASARLAEAGYLNQAVFFAYEHAGQEEDTVRSAVENGLLPEAQANLCIRSLQQSRSLVSVTTVVGRTHQALDIMESAGAVDADIQRRYTISNPTPFSDALGIAALTRFVPITALASPYWRFSSLLGLGLLSRNPTPLSSIFGMKVVSTPKRPWTSSFGLPLLSGKSAPSSSFGIKTVVQPKRPWDWSWGLPLLLRNPAPLSSMFGIPPLSNERSRKR